MPADAGSPAPSRSTPARGVGKQRGGATSSDVDADYGRALKRVAVAPPRTRRGAGSAGSVGSDGSVANLTAAAGASGGAACADGGAGWVGAGAKDDVAGGWEGFA